MTDQSEKKEDALDLLKADLVSWSDSGDDIDEGSWGMVEDSLDRYVRACGGEP